MDNLSNELQERISSLVNQKIIQQKDVLCVDDIAAMFCVSKDTAYDYIAGIRAVSDTLGMAGKVHRQDYEYWLKMRIGKSYNNKDERRGK